VPDYETRDANTRGVWIFAASLAASLALILLAAGFFLHWLSTHPSSPVQATRIVESPASAPTPALQVNPAADLAAYKARERALLDSCGWIDRRAGIARIPIDRAMALVVQRGANVGPGAPAPQPLTPLEMQQQKARERSP
jgi:hypothetical protein